MFTKFRGNNVDTARETLDRIVAPRFHLNELLPSLLPYYFSSWPMWLGNNFGCRIRMRLKKKRKRKREMCKTGIDFLRV